MAENAVIGMDPSAEQVGAERIEAIKDTLEGGVDRVKNFMGPKLDSMREKVSKAGGFLKRLGLAALAPDVAMRNAASATVEAGSDAYNYVSEGTKKQAEVAAVRIKDAYGRVEQKTGEVYASSKEKCGQFKATMSEKRQAIVDKIQDGRLSKQIKELQAREEGVSEEIQYLNDLVKQRRDIRKQIGDLERLRVSNRYS